MKEELIEKEGRHFFLVRWTKCKSSLFYCFTSSLFTAQRQFFREFCYIFSRSKFNLPRKMCRKPSRFFQVFLKELTRCKWLHRRSRNATTTLLSTSWTTFLCVFQNCRKQHRCPRPSCLCLLTEENQKLHQFSSIFLAKWTTSNTQDTKPWATIQHTITNTPHQITSR